eukprot:8241109-Prorocentrum_lima.AAC.1
MMSSCRPSLVLGLRLVIAGFSSGLSPHVCKQSNTTSHAASSRWFLWAVGSMLVSAPSPVSYTHLRAHETRRHL